MSKTGYTKNRILDLVATSNKVSLSYISDTLKLHPSTVSQHLQELKEMGAIQEVHNEYIKKWKYYALKPGFNPNALAIENVAKSPMAGSTALYAILLGIALVATVAYLLWGGSLHLQRGATLSVFLTDPPSVPAGTQALYINFSSVSVHIAGNQTPGWLQSNGSGSINLMSLINSTKLIAGIRVPQGADVDQIRMNITSARIVINGTSYNLILRNGEIDTELNGNGNTGAVLLDLSPIVTPMYINGVSLLVMLPQAASVPLNSSALAYSSSTLSAAELEALKLVDPNLSVTDPQLTTSDNGSIKLQITVSNYGSKSVVLRDILVLGAQDLVNYTSALSPSPALHVTPNHIGAEFTVSGDGNLSFANAQNLTPSLERINYIYPYDASGYVLSENSSVTMTFEGPLSISNTTYIALIRNESYKISVLGDYISHLKVNVTAG